MDKFLIAQGLIEERDILDIANIYWDVDGNLRHGKSDRDRDAEVLDILSRDENEEKEEAVLWMIIPSRWVRSWLLFAHLKVTDEAPGPIDMETLLQKDNSVETGWRPKNTLRPPGRGPQPNAPPTQVSKGKNTKQKSDAEADDFPGHYRRISLEAWLLLVDLYGITEPRYAIAVRGTPYHDVNRWRVFKNPREIDSEKLPEGNGKHWKVDEVIVESKRSIFFKALGFK